MMVYAKGAVVPHAEGIVATRPVNNEADRCVEPRQMVRTRFTWPRVVAVLDRCTRDMPTPVL